MGIRIRRERPKPLYTKLDLKKDLKVYSGIKYISGHGIRPHVDYGEYAERMKWMMFFRNPAKRFVSLYIHQQRRNGAKYSMDIYKWADTFKRSNGQVKFIAGEENIEKAKEILSSLDLTCCLTESFTESLFRVKESWGLEGLIIPKVEKNKVVDNNPLKQEFAENYEKYKDFIDEYNQLDSELYDFVNKKIISQNIKVDNCELDDINTKYKFNNFLFKTKDRMIYRPYLKLTGEKAI